MKSRGLVLRSAEREGGFTLIELLIAMAITLIIAGAIAGAAPPARDAFERMPADLDLQQRGRTAIDVLSQALRAAGKNVAATEALAPLSDLLPSVSVAEEDESGHFTELTAIIPVPDAAQGLLAVDQSSPGAAMTLAADHCPDVKDACGFTPGTTAVVADGAGHFEVFSIGATNAGARRVAPAGALSRAYPAGSVIVEADQWTFAVAGQPDGSGSLIRTTAAGAIQPIVDFVNGLSFDVIGRDAAAGFFQIQQVDVWLSVEAPTDLLRRAIPDRVFRTSIRLRNVS
jgi:prepilin-type N-terminal cleavage/methylation domain-containing protein